MHVFTNNRDDTDFSSLAGWFRRRVPLALAHSDQEITNNSSPTKRNNVQALRRFGAAITSRSRSVKLLYIDPG